MAGGAYGYSQAIIFWVFALLFYVGAIMVDDGTINFLDFFTAMFAVIFGAFGVGQVWRCDVVLRSVLCHAVAMLLLLLCCFAMLALLCYILLAVLCLRSGDTGGFCLRNLEARRQVFP